MPRSDNTTYKKVELWKRFYNYIHNVGKKDPLRKIPRSTLFHLATREGYPNPVIWTEIKRMEQERQIINYYEKDLGVVYHFGFFTKEEIKKQIEDDEWFDSLPDKPPTKPE